MATLNEKTCLARALFGGGGTGGGGSGSYYGVAASGSDDGYVSITMDDGSVITIPTVGAIREGDGVHYVIRDGKAYAIGSAGWGDRVGSSIASAASAAQAAEEAADEAKEIAEAADAAAEAAIEAAETASDAADSALDSANEAKRIAEDADAAAEAAAAAASAAATAAEAAQDTADDAKDIAETAYGNAEAAAQEAEAAAGAASAASGVAQAAQSVANATAQHFRWDNNGAYVETSTHDIQLTAQGFNLRKIVGNVKTVLATMYSGAVGFFDGNGTGDGNVVASFGATGAEIGQQGTGNHRVSISAMGILLSKWATNTWRTLASFTQSGIAFYDGNGQTAANQTALFGNNAIELGKKASGENGIAISPSGILLRRWQSSSVARTLASFTGSQVDFYDADGDSVSRFGAARAELGKVALGERVLTVSNGAVRIRKFLGTASDFEGVDLASFTDSGFTVFDGTGNSASNVTGLFSSDAIRLGRISDGEPNIAVTPSGILLRTTKDTAEGGRTVQTQCNRAAFLPSGIAFYDGVGDTNEHLRAFFGYNGIEIGQFGSGECAMSINSGTVAFTTRSGSVQNTIAQFNPYGTTYFDTDGEILATYASSAVQLGKKQDGTQNLAISPSGLLIRTTHDETIGGDLVHSQRNLASFTGSGVALYDGDGNAASNVVAQFAKNLIKLGGGSASSAINLNDGLLTITANSDSQHVGRISGDCGSSSNNPYAQTDIGYGTTNSRNFGIVSLEAGDEISDDDYAYVNVYGPQYYSGGSKASMAKVLVKSQGVSGTLADWPIERGSGSGASAGWDYCKWASGKLECWYSGTQSLAVNEPWGALYESAQFQIPNYPVAFAAVHCLTPSARDNSGALGVLSVEMEGMGTTSAPPKMRITRATADTATWRINCYVYGRWK